MKAAKTAKNMVTAPSIQNSQRHAAWPRTPCMLDRTPAPTRAEKALEMRLPQNRRALREVNSRRVYHLDRMSNAPGRKAASMKPNRKRMATMCPKVLALPDNVEMRPQRSMAQ